MIIADQFSDGTELLSAREDIGRKLDTIIHFIF